MRSSDSQTDGLLHVKRFSAGAFAGAFTKTSVAPIERLKSLLQLVEGQRGLLPTVRTVLQREGVMSFWRGNAANVARVIPVDGTRMALNDYFKSLLSTGPGPHTTLQLITVRGGVAWKPLLVRNTVTGGFVAGSQLRSACAAHADDAARGRAHKAHGWLDAQPTPSLPRHLALVRALVSCVLPRTLCINAFFVPFAAWSTRCNERAFWRCEFATAIFFCMYFRVMLPRVVCV